MAMMNQVEQMEYEKNKLTQLGIESLANGIPLYANEALQAQSRKDKHQLRHAMENEPAASGPYSPCYPVP